MTSRRKTFDLGHLITDVGKLGAAITLPNEVGTETIAIIGRRGSGKSNTLTAILEGLMENGYPIVLIDPKGEGWGLRRKAEKGGKAGFPVVLFGEPQGDLPLREEHGPMVADYVVDSGNSCVLSLAGFATSAAERRFVTNFCDQLYRRKMKPENQTPLLVAIEEAHLFCPQRVGPEETAMVRTIQRLVRQGRSYGIGVAIADQRPASVNKDILTQLEILICHQLTAPHDRKAVKEWVDAHDVDEQGKAFMESLAGLKPGQAWVWSPARLDVFERVQVRRRWTYDSGATPTQLKAKPPGEAAKVDLDALRKQLAEAVEQAKANDPKELRKQIAELKKQLSSAKPTAHTTTIDNKAIREAELAAAEKARKILGAQFLKRVQKLKAELEAKGAKVSVAVDGYYDAQTQALAGLISGVEVDAATTAHGISDELDRRAAGAGRGVIASDRAARRGQLRAGVDEGRTARPTHGANARGGEGTALVVPDAAGMTGPQQRILDAYAMWKSVGIDRPNRRMIMLLAGYTNQRSKGFTNPLGQLRTMGFITGDNLTEAGRAQLTAIESALTLEELHNRIRSLIKPVESRILDIVINSGGRIGRHDLMEAAGYTNERSKGFSNSLGSLRTIGLIDYDSSDVIATDVVFPEGLT